MPEGIKQPTSDAAQRPFGGLGGRSDRARAVRRRRRSVVTAPLLNFIGGAMLQTSQFSRPVAAQIRRLAGTMSVAEIAALVRMNPSTLKYHARRHRIAFNRPDQNLPTVFTAARVEKIRAMLGRATARQIATEVGVTLPSLKSWAKRKGVSLARPASSTRCAKYNRLRQRAHQLGLRLSVQGGRVSLWVSVRQDMTFAEAEWLLRDANRRARFDAAERAFDCGAAKLNGAALATDVTEPAEQP